MALSYTARFLVLAVGAPPFAKRAPRQRRGEQLSLRQVAAERLQRLARLRELHALGEDAEAEVVREVDRAAHHGAVAGVGDEAGHERAIDLDLVDREALEMGERGVAGAEIVEGESHADAFQAREDGDRALRFGDERALRELEHHARRVEAPGPDSLVDDRRQLAIVERGERAVDR